MSLCIFPLSSCDTDLYTPAVVTAVPVAPRINVAALIEQSSLESGWDNSLEAGGVLTHGQASKALCGLSQEVDRSVVYWAWDLAGRIIPFSMILVAQCYTVGATSHYGEVSSKSKQYRYL